VARSTIGSEGVSNRRRARQITERKIQDEIAHCILATLALGAATAAQVNVPPGHAVATFAGGCFWCMEPPYDKLPGVTATISGYMGGTKANPSYQEVSSGTTGHAEVVQVVYDPKKVSYEKLLEVFWVNVDPTVRDPAVLRFRIAIPDGDLLPRCGAAQGRGSVEGRDREIEAVQAADRHADRDGGTFLSRRGLSPGLLPEEPGAIPALPHRLRPADARLKELWGDRAGK
jgi:peptide-methionine (S)-S-oxide reductase